MTLVGASGGQPEGELRTATLGLPRRVSDLGVVGQFVGVVITDHSR
jgi:hypothetical protein